MSLTHEQAAPMLQKRGSHTCTSCGGALYAIGGWDSVNFLSSMEMYDPRADAWLVRAPPSLLCPIPQWVQRWTVAPQHAYYDQVILD